MQQMEERIEQAIRQAEARGFANAMQMMQAGMTLPSPAASMPAQHSPVPHPDSAEDRTLDEKSLVIAMDFIDSL